eukprot:6200427-Pleurochrysis_carterae.AAC.2
MWRNATVEVRQQMSEEKESKRKGEVDEVESKKRSQSGDSGACSKESAGEGGRRAALMVNGRTRRKLRRER